MKCPGSIQLSGRGPAQIESKYALEGTKAHEMLEEKLRQYISIGKYFYTNDNDNKDMADSVSECISYVKNILDNFPGAQIYIEQELKMRDFLFDFGGTVDILIYEPTMGILWVIDFKYGAGEVVEITNNTQIKSYALLAINNLKLNPLMIIGVIIQPRAFHEEGRIRETTWSYEDVNSFFLEINKSIQKCEKPDAPLIPGQSQCRWCPAKSICPAVEAKALSVVADTFKDIKQVTSLALPDVKSLPLDRIAYVLSAAPLLTDWLKEIEEIALSYAREGIEIPGHKLVHAWGRRKWFGRDDELAATLMRLLEVDIDQVAPRALITITAAETELKRKFKSQNVGGSAKAAASAATQTISAMCLKEPSTSTTLVPISDSREPVRPNSAFDSVRILPAEKITDKY
jgi:hypothetical protein